MDSGQRVEMPDLQRELAERAGVTHATVLRVELGQQAPRAATRRRLAAALNLEPAQIAWPA